MRQTGIGSQRREMLREYEDKPGDPMHGVVAHWRGLGLTASHEDSWVAAHWTLVLQMSVSTEVDGNLGRFLQIA